MARKKVIGIRPRKKVGHLAKILSKESVLLVQEKYCVVTMRRDGYTMQEIAECLGISIGKVFTLLKDVLQETIIKYQETTEESRQLQLQRLDSLLKVWMPLARGYIATVADTTVPGGSRQVEIKPSIAAAQYVLFIEKRRAELLALDVPETKKLDVSGVREYIGVDVDKV